MRAQSVVLAACAGLIVALGVWAATGPAAEREIASYVTSLEGRSPSQVHNVTLAAKAVDNTVLLPGRTFSFVKTVGPWTADRGYVKAMVSYDGELVRNWGGGVCQASTALYNAALLAGLEIVERHRHHWPARYAAPGRDAAVAYEDIDLRFKNNLAEPVRIVCSVNGDSLTFRVFSRVRPARDVRIESEVRSVTRQSEVIDDRAPDTGGRRRLVNAGCPGIHVVTFRRFVYSGGSRRELVSEDRYPAMNRVVRIEER